MEDSTSNSNLLSRWHARFLDYWRRKRKRRAGRRWGRDKGIHAKRLRFSYDLGPQSVVFDCGAYLGNFAAELVERYQCEVFCFEPEPDSFRLLRFNLAHNGCGFAQALEKAVGGQSRTAQITLKQDSPGGTSIYSPAPGGERPPGSAIQVVALSEWLGQTPGTFDLLKMDCEGSEWEIVRRTSLAELARFRVVVAEVHSDPEGLQPVEKFEELIQSCGFRTVRWDRKSHGLYVGVRASQAPGL